MADSNIGALPQAPSLDDDSLMVVEQQGTAMKMTGAQFKEFGKQSVMREVQDLVDEAQAAADSAESAVGSVVNMTVEVSTLASGAPATVTKTMKQGKVNLSFGLPRGAQGIPGPKGDTGDPGQRGPKGDPGEGLEIAGRYDTTDDVPNPQEGKSYYIGASAPYDLYTYLDGVWVNNGPISGGGGGVVPENVVTSEGGASFEYGAGVGGEAPHVITFTTEEEPPLTAEDVNYSDTQTVKDAIDGLKASVSNGKGLIASAITDKGVTTAQDATFARMAENIGQISTGTDTSDATAAAGDILYPKTAYTASGRVTGRIPSLGAQTITPGTSAKSIASGQYLAGPQTIAGDPNLTSANIKKGVSIFGVAGAVESSFKATLTVTVDVGAEVRATCGDKSISALSTTGTVVMELPSEGTWSITAARGMTQYTTAVITVASQFSAALEPAVHIDYFVTATPLSKARGNLAAAAVGNYALFAGGDGSYFSSDVVDAYDTELTRSNPASIGSGLQARLSATAIGNYALFAGGDVDNGGVYAYDENLVRRTTTALSEARTGSAATTIGNYALFGGGAGYSTTVDAYNLTLTRSTPSLPLVQGRYGLSAASTENHALFAGGGTSSGYSAVVDAYDKELTRSTPSALGYARSSTAAANAGAYALFGGGSGFSSRVDAYDITLTRSSALALTKGRSVLSATTLKGYAMFGGGETDIVNVPDTLNAATFTGIVEVYDAALARNTIESLGEARGFLAAASIGDYALFAGGFNKIDVGGSGSRNTYYQIDTVDVYRYE